MAIGDRLKRAGLAAIRFLGPVANAVYGELSKQETGRALAKAVVVGLATRASVVATVQDPTVMADVVIPLAAAAFAGVLDAISRWQQGEPKPIPPPDPKPVP